MRTRPLPLAGTVVVLLAVVLTALAPRPGQSPPAPTTAQAHVLDAFNRLPLHFEAREDRAGGEVRFLARTKDATLSLAPTEALLTVGGATLQVQLLGANPAPVLQGLDPLPGAVNHFIGNDPTRWRTGIPSYARVRYQEVYPGIDLVFHGNWRQIEYDFIVAPGADPNAIRLSFAGAERVDIDAAGDLVLRTAAGELRQRRPLLYQVVNGVRREFAGGFRLMGSDRDRAGAHLEVGFAVGDYDRTRPLVIDPVIYATYLGGGGNDIGQSVAVDSAGNAYIVGYTSGLGFPVTASLQPAPGGGVDAYVVKLNPSGSSILYATYLGGRGDDNAIGVAVDGAGNAYITGTTTSPDFPLLNPLQAAHAGGLNDAFVVKLSPTGGTLIYATYLGGNGVEGAEGIGVDAVGSVIVAGSTTSTDLPTTPDAVQPASAGGYDGFVARLDSTGTTIIYLTYLGGTGHDAVLDLAVDGTGSAFVTGLTLSADFPTFAAVQPVLRGTSDAFIVKLSPSGTTFAFATYLGGSGNDRGEGIAIDGGGGVWITGETSSADFPLANPLRLTLGGITDAFVVRLDPAGSTIVYATYLGGDDHDTGWDLAVDSAGSVHVVGETASPGTFATPDAFQPLIGGGADGFLVRLSMDGGSIMYATYLGGTGWDRALAVTVDEAGGVYIIGFTWSSNFPATGGVQRAHAGGFGDAFAVKVVVAVCAGVCPTPMPTPTACPPRTGCLTPTATVTAAPTLTATAAATSCPRGGCPTETPTPTPPATVSATATATATVCSARVGCASPTPTVTATSTVCPPRGGCAAPTPTSTPTPAATCGRIC